MRIIPAVDESEEIVAFVQTVSGKIVLLALFALGLWLHGRDWWPEATLVLGLMSFLPSYRRHMLLGAMVFWLWKHSPLPWHILEQIERMAGLHALLITIPRMVFWLAELGLVFVFFAAFYWLAERYKTVKPMNRPVRTLIVCYVAALLGAGYLDNSTLIAPIAWGFLSVLGVYIWFFAYSLLDVGSSQRRPFPMQLGHYQPFWMLGSGTLVPFPKGDAYLRKIESKDAGHLAVTQLKGVKLLYWALLLVILKAAFDGFFYSAVFTLGSLSFAMPMTLPIPQFEEVFRLSSSATPAYWYINWAALGCRFFWNVLALAIFGHVVISVCRMAGFRALRNTYAPLKSATIAEFWNRYYYYFKELLVDFFFYPTYLRYFKRWPRIRLIAATLAAATFGNVLYHFLRDLDYIIELGLWGAAKSFGVYMFYGLILGLAISASQLRNSKRKIDRTSFRARYLAPLTVICFYCVLSVFLEQSDRDAAALDYFRFVGDLVPRW